jgi:hypothetical protein
MDSWSTLRGSLLELQRVAKVSEFIGEASGKDIFGGTADVKDD